MQGVPNKKPARRDCRRALQVGSVDETPRRAVSVRFRKKARAVVPAGLVRFSLKVAG
jgi:hypothetical protein